MSEGSPPDAAPTNRRDLSDSSPSRHWTGWSSGFSHIRAKTSQFLSEASERASSAKVRDRLLSDPGCCSTVWRSLSSPISLQRLVPLNAIWPTLAQGAQRELSRTHRSQKRRLAGTSTHFYQDVAMGAASNRPLRLVPSTQVSRHASSTSLHSQACSVAPTSVSSPSHTSQKNSLKPGSSCTGLRGEYWRSPQQPIIGLMVT